MHTYMYMYIGVHTSDVASRGSLEYSTSSHLAGAEGSTCPRAISSSLEWCSGRYWCAIVMCSCLR